jgi:hypothetical protein
MFAHSHPTEVRDAARAVLSAWGLQAYTHHFLSSADGIALAAHLCDAGVAFSDDDTLYGLFRPLVKYVAEFHPLSRYSDCVLHIQTVVGPVTMCVHFDSEELLEMNIVSGYAGACAVSHTLDKAQKMAYQYLGL